MLIHSYTPYLQVTHNTYTGWRRLIRRHKLQVIFRKRATTYTALLQEMTYKNKASYDSTPPCIYSISTSTSR